MTSGINAAESHVAEIASSPSSMLAAALGVFTRSLADEVEQMGSGITEGLAAAEGLANLAVHLQGFDRMRQELEIVANLLDRLGSAPALDQDGLEQLLAGILVTHVRHEIGDLLDLKRIIQSGESPDAVF